MDVLFLSRLQFAVTTVYHFFFVPLTLGLSLMVAIMETQYVRTGDETYKRMTKFWGTLFLINFAMGLVTGLVQEFQFGMNWSEYSRFVGDIFGAPLAMEALLAFFLESVFLGVWIFGWDKLSKKQHVAAMWLVAIGSNISAFWILVANSWMQQPVGYVLEDGRAVMTDFAALLSNGHVWVQFPHVIFSAWATAGFFVLGFSAWHMRNKSKQAEVFRRSFKYGLVFAALGALLVAFSGHAQAQHMVKIQPMKMAAAEALWESEEPAALSLFSISDTENRSDTFSIRVPAMLSLLACNNTSCLVEGINDIQARYEGEFGAGNYIPPVTFSYWSFRIMVGVGLLMLLLLAYGLFLWWSKKDLTTQRKFLRVMVWALFLPYIANSLGWLFTEVGRQPWIVFRLMLTDAGVTATAGMHEVAASLIVYTLLYGALIVADVYLLLKFGRQAPEDSGGGDEAAEAEAAMAAA